MRITKRKRSYVIGKYRRYARFKKIHERARRKIDEFIEGASELIQASCIQKILKAEVQLNVSKVMIQRYLKQQLGLTYKIIRPITANHNLPKNKLKRQYAAAQYIQHLYEGKRIINIDESNLDETDHRRRGWNYPRKRN